METTIQSEKNNAVDAHSCCWWEGHRKGFGVSGEVWDAHGSIPQGRDRGKVGEWEKYLGKDLREKKPREDSSGLLLFGLQSKERFIVPFPYNREIFYSDALLKIDYLHN